MSPDPYSENEEEDLHPFPEASYPVIEFTPWLGLFETIRVLKGHPLLLDEHLQNLREGSKALGLPTPPDFSSFASSLPPQSGRWRWIHEAHGSRHFFQMESADQPPTYSVEIAAQRVGSHNWDARYKTLSYLTHWQARRSVATNEALLLNEYGEIASGSMSNVFWVLGGHLFTPYLETGCRNGAVRRWIVENFHPHAIRAEVKALHEAEEIFLTNSIIGVKPIGRFCSRELAVGPMTSKILEKYQTECVESIMGPPREPDLPSSRIQGVA